MDTLPVVGNNAVHPGEVNVDEQSKTAQALFMLLDVVVKDRIAAFPQRSMHCSSPSRRHRRRLSITAIRGRRCNLVTNRPGTHDRRHPAGR